jgi:hypothetical protein
MECQEILEDCLPLSTVPIPLPSVWGKTLIFRWLYPRKLVNLSESDGRALCIRRIVWFCSRELVSFDELVRASL